MAAGPARPPGGASRPASSAGAVPGGRLRAERPDAAPPLQGAPRRRRREVTAVPPSGRESRRRAASRGRVRFRASGEGPMARFPSRLLQADSALFHGRLPGQGGVPQGLLERRRGAELGRDHQPAVADVRAPRPLFTFSLSSESSRGEDVRVAAFAPSQERRRFKREPRRLSGLGI